MSVKKVDSTKIKLINQLDLRFVRWTLNLANAIYEGQKRLKIKEMLDKLDNFCSYAMTRIQILINAHHIFCKQLDFSNYIAKLLEKDKFHYNNFENVSNQRHYYRSFAYGLINYIQVWGRFLTSIIVNAIIIVFYKSTWNSKLSFNISTINNFSLFRFKILVFLFTMVHCGISKFQNGGKIIILFDKNTLQNLYIFLN